MIQKIASTHQDILAFEAVGTVTKEDYDKVLRPVLESAYNEGRKIRFLYLFGDKFEGFSPAAAWEDFKVGVQYIRLFERCAVVTDNRWIANMSSFFGSLMPLSVRVFPVKETNAAMAWLDSGEIAIEHHLDTEKGVLTVELSAPLKSEDFEALAHAVDPWITKENKLNGIVVHAKKFPGWENIGSFIEHFRFIGGHHRRVRRVALAVDGVVAEMVPRFANHFVEAEIKHFGYDDLVEAKNWASAST